MHELGRLTTYMGSIKNKEPDSYSLINDMSIIVNKETGSIIGYGDTYMSNIKERFDKRIEKCKKICPEDVENIVLINFDRFFSILNIDDICSITNYFLENMGPEKLEEVFSSNEEQLKLFINKIQKIGY